MLYMFLYDVPFLSEHFFLTKIKKKIFKLLGPDVRHWHNTTNQAAKTEYSI